jgi:uncharacterized membrane protein YgaE (UPF0421/DUF939 family)
MKLNYYISGMHADGKKLVTGFSWKNKRVKRAAKTAMSAVIAVYICYSLNLGDALFAGITAMIMLQPNFGATIKKGLLRTVGTITGFFLSIFIFGLCVQNHIAYSAAIFLIMAIVFYKKATAKYSYAWYLVGITYIIITMVGLTEPDSTKMLIDIAVHRTSNVIIGILVSLVIDIYIWPDYAFETMNKKLRKVKSELSVFYKKIFTEYLTMKYDLKDIVAEYNRLKSELMSVEGLLGAAAIEAKMVKGAVVGAEAKCKRMHYNIDKIYDFFNSIRKLKNVSYQKKYSTICLKIITEIDKYYSFIEKNDLKMQNETNNRIINLFSLLDLKYKKDYIRGKNRNHTVADVLLFHEFVLILKEIHLMYRNYSKRKLNTYEEMVQKKTINVKKKMFDFYQGKFLGFDIFIHIPSLKYAVKGGISVVFVIWGFYFSELPKMGMGGLEIAVAVMTVVQPDLVSSNLKSILRVSGCFIGLILGFMFLGMQIESTELMFFIFFWVMFLSGYIITGGPNISYLGLQIAIAYMIATIHGPAPETDVEFVLYRFIGIFFAIAIVWCINISFWNENLLVTLKKRIKNIWEMLGTTKVSTKEVLFGYPLLEMILSLKLSLKTMYGLHDINREQMVVIEEWIDLQERLSFALNTLNNMDEETISFIRNLKPGIFFDIEKLVKKISEKCINEEPLNMSDFNFSELIAEVEELKLLLRRGAMKDKEIAVKQNYSHTVLTLKRVVVKLKSITEHQAQINLLTF